MLKKSLKTTVLAAVATLSLYGFVQSAQAQVVDGVDAKTVQTLKANFEKKTKVPASQINYIGNSDFKGVYVVLANGYSLPVYSDINFDKMFVGNYIDNNRDQVNIVDEIKTKNFKIPVSKFNPKNLITDKYGNGSKKVYIFADANCTYCKKLETEVLSQLQDTTVYTVPITILRPGGEADQKVRTLLCKPEAEQGKLFVGVMLRNEGDIGDQNCEKAKALETNTALSKEVGVSGTPTLVFANGSVHTGYIGLFDLQEKLKAIQ